MAAVNRGAGTAPAAPRPHVPVRIVRSAGPEPHLSVRRHGPTAGPAWHGPARHSTAQHRPLGGAQSLLQGAGRGSGSRTGSGSGKGGDRDAPGAGLGGLLAGPRAPDTALPRLSPAGTGRTRTGHGKRPRLRSRLPGTIPGQRCLARYTPNPSLTPRREAGAALVPLVPHWCLTGATGAAGAPLVPPGPVPAASPGRAQPRGRSAPHLPAPPEPRGTGEQEPAAVPRRTLSGMGKCQWVAELEQPLPRLPSQGEMQRWGAPVPCSRFPRVPGQLHHPVQSKYAKTNVRAPVGAGSAASAGLRLLAAARGSRAVPRSCPALGKAAPGTALWNLCLPVGFAKASPAPEELGEIFPALISPGVKRDPERSVPSPGHCQPRALPRSAVPERGPAGHGAAAAAVAVPGTRCPRVPVSPCPRVPGAQRCPLPPGQPQPQSRTCGPAAAPASLPLSVRARFVVGGPAGTAPAPGASSGAGTGSAERAEWQAARR
ncbi:basic proline-rich protein-like [Melozone crissalis]|uniref:basic proline-rich protein-like n=1 Tax=Melozone crissalis TaxID=40204 RepID=UPI0023D9FE17|nr:basic proline-rich protein-like [Melozone crissalis]